MKKIQIGVFGSMADIKLAKSVEQLAKQLGKEIAKNDALLVFGFEGDFNSVSSIAAQTSEASGGQTLAFVWGSKKPELKKLSSVQIVTGQQRGGGREFSLILSCDVVICISGGSGTLMEITMAYQAGIPIIVLENSGGWSEKLANTYLDERKRELITLAKNPHEAVKLAIRLAKATEK